MVCIRQVTGLDVGVAVVASFAFDAPPEERGAVVDEEDRAPLRRRRSGRFERWPKERLVEDALEAKPGPGPGGWEAS
jgi:hypothetical protein